MTDLWKIHISPEKLAAYKKMIDKGLIKDVHVTYYRGDKVTKVEYQADHPHEWILEELRKAVAE